MTTDSPRLSRRDVLAQFAGIAAAGGATAFARRAAAEPAAAADGPILDVHVHANFHDPVLKHQAETLSGVAFSPEGLKTEMHSAGVEQALVIGFETDGKELSHHAANPLGRGNFAWNSSPDDKIWLIGGINPYRLDAEGLKDIEEALKAGKLKGLKIYLGYYHRFPDDEVYKPVYELAGKYGVPVVLHTGDTYSANAKVRFAHPLRIDDVAVDFREVTFVVAHLGNPWTIDAAELLYKNPNVYADLSGFLVGDAKYFADPKNAAGIDHAVDRIRRAFAWAENPRKFLYGSDWPLAPMKAYAAFIRRAIPAEHHRRVFYENAKAVFKLP